MPNGASGAPIRRPALAALLLVDSWPLRALARNYWTHDVAKMHRERIGKCTNYECSAFQRPVPKKTSEYKPWALDACPNMVDGSEHQKYGEMLGACCFGKFVCMQTCGMDMQTCFDNYWECAEHACYKLEDMAQTDCLRVATSNDIRYLSWNKSDVSIYRKPKDAEVCSTYHGLQKGACDCVPQSEWEKTQKARFEELFAEHSPEMVNKKGQLKDKKLWKAWKGKRPQLWYRFVMKHQDKLIERRETGDAKDPNMQNAKAAEL